MKCLIGFAYQKSTLRALAGSSRRNFDTCIVLRTAVVKDGVLHIQAGAGVVADSVPESEDAECRAKSQALIRAAQEAVAFASLPSRGQ